MANDPSAQATEAEAPSETEYQAFFAALTESARGRAFLAEHARRSRAADSEMVLSAVQRLEGLVRDQATTIPVDNVGDELRGMRDAIRAVQAEFDVSALADRVTELAAVLNTMQARIESLVTPPPVMPPAAPAPEEPTGVEEPADEDPLTVTTMAAVEPDVDAPAAALDAPAVSLDDELDMPEMMAAAAIIDDEPEAFSEPAIAPEPLPELETAPAFDVAPESPVDDTSDNDSVPAFESAAEETTDVESAAIDDVVAADIEFIAAQPDVDAPSAADMDAAETSTMPEVAWGDENGADDKRTPMSNLAIAAVVETLAMPSPGVGARKEDGDEPPEAKVIKAGSIPPPPPFAGEDFTGAPRARTALPPVDPLADIKALSDEERLALFT